MSSAGPQKRGARPWPIWPMRKFVTDCTQHEVHLLAKSHVLFISTKIKVDCISSQFNLLVHHSMNISVLSVKRTGL